MFVGIFWHADGRREPLWPRRRCSVTSTLSLKAGGMPRRVELDLLYGGFLEESWAPVSPLEAGGAAAGRSPSAIVERGLRVLLSRRS